jgi:hypothetical protein
MTKKDPKGISEIDRLVIKYMGLSDEWFLHQNHRII